MSETASSRRASQTGQRASDPKLLELLVCPLTKGTLSYDAGRQELVSRHARLAYPIRDGIAIMLPSEARSLEEDELG
jgi:uncharacterized protein YbaR (Trm112 family)